jgi:hypothetical protein
MGAQGLGVVVVLLQLSLERGELVPLDRAHTHSQPIKSENTKQTLTQHKIHWKEKANAMEGNVLWLHRCLPQLARGALPWSNGGPQPAQRAGGSSRNRLALNIRTTSG